MHRRKKLKSSSLWVEEFSSEVFHVLQKQVKDHKVCTLTLWFLGNVVFRSTYFCEQIFSLMTNMFSTFRDVWQLYTVSYMYSTNSKIPSNRSLEKLKTYSQKTTMNLSLCRKASLHEIWPSGSAKSHLPTSHQFWAHLKLVSNSLHAKNPWSCCFLQWILLFNL